MCSEIGQFEFPSSSDKHPVSRGFLELCQEAACHTDSTGLHACITWGHQETGVTATEWFHKITGLNWDIWDLQSKHSLEDLCEYTAIFTVQTSGRKFEGSGPELHHFVLANTKHSTSVCNLAWASCSSLYISRNMQDFIAVRKSTAWDNS